MTILCYHDVNDQWESPLAVRQRAFEQQCAWLASARSVSPLEHAVQRLDRRGRLPRGSVALTFDDGFAELHDVAWPILRRHGLPWTVFLVAQTLTEDGKAVDWVDTPPDWTLATLTSQQVLELHEGGVHMGSHSWAHHDLTQLTESECERDLRASRELLEDLLEGPVSTLAYPRGRHAAHVRRAARRAGYALAFTLPQERETVDHYSIPRVGIWRDNRLTTVKTKGQRNYLGARTSPVWNVLRGARRVADLVRGRP